jgi:CheY-like chemotaxis protein
MTMKAFAVVEDDPDDQLLVQALFYPDPRFSLAGVADSAEEALERAGTKEPGIVVLDHALAGELTGLDAAPLFKALAPQVKVILFTAHAELQALCDEVPSIDAFLLKTDALQLLPLAQRLTGLRVR